MAKDKINIMESVTPVEAPTITKTEKELAKEKLERYRNEEMKMVKGIFKNFETPGAGATIQVKKYKGHFFNQTMQDGQEYEVPLYVARHLNGIDVTAEAIGGKLGTCSYPVHSHIMDQNGNPIPHVAKRKQRYGFQSLQFEAA